MLGRSTQLRKIMTGPIRKPDADGAATTYPMFKGLKWGACFAVGTPAKQVHWCWWGGISFSVWVTRWIGWCVPNLPVAVTRLHTPRVNTQHFEPNYYFRGSSMGSFILHHSTKKQDWIFRYFLGIKITYYWMVIRWVLRFAFLLFSPSFCRIFFRWVSMVRADRVNNSAISFVVLPCFNRFAIWTSEGVRCINFIDKDREKEEVISFRFDPRISTNDFCLEFKLVWTSLST